MSVALSWPRKILGQNEVSLYEGLYFDLSNLERIRVAVSRQLPLGLPLYTDGHTHFALISGYIVLLHKLFTSRASCSVTSPLVPYFFRFDFFEYSKSTW